MSKLQIIDKNSDGSIAVYLTDIGLFCIDGRKVYAYTRKPTEELAAESIQEYILKCWDEDTPNQQ